MYIFAFTEQYDASYQIRRQGLVIRKLYGRLRYLISFQIIRKLLQQLVTPRAGKGNVVRVGRIIDQKEFSDFECRYLVTDYFFHTGNRFMNDFPDLLHPFLDFNWKCSLILVDGFEVCLRHNNDCKNNDCKSTD